MLAGDRRDHHLLALAIPATSCPVIGGRTVRPLLDYPPGCPSRDRGRAARRKRQAAEESGWDPASASFPFKLILGAAGGLSGGRDVVCSAVSRVGGRDVLAGGVLPKSMASIVGKKISGKTYYYLVESARVDGKPRIVSQQYLGPADEVTARLAGSGPGDPDPGANT